MNYFNYFTEIEEHFQRKRGQLIPVSPLDWALIDSWRAAGIPLAAALAGIDKAFAKFESGRRRDRARPRSLAYCAAAVLDAGEAAQAAAIGAASPEAAARADATGFTPARVLAFLEDAARQLATSPALDPALAATREIQEALGNLIAGLAAGAPAALEEMDRVLTVLDDKLQALLQQSLAVDDMVRLRAELDREVAPFRHQLKTEQLAMIERQFLHRRLLERARLPRLSLFYMP